MVNMVLVDFAVQNAQGLFTTKAKKKRNK